MGELKNKKILVAGAIRQQGGDAVSHLLAQGHRVRVLEHDPGKAKVMQGPDIHGIRDPDLQVIQGNIRKQEDLEKALDGVGGVFLMSHSGEGPEEEVSHGKAVIDACAEKEIGHVVYSSVCCANKKTGVPQFDSKYAIEEYLKESGLSYTILRPVWFMEHFASPWYRPSIEKGVLATPLRADRPLQMVSADDIGRIVAEVFTKPSKFTEREIDIAGDQLTMNEIAAEISRVLNHPVRYEQIPEDRAGEAVGQHWIPMFRWLNEHGYDADLWLVQKQFQRFQISLISFRDFCERSRLGMKKAA